MKQNTKKPLTRRRARESYIMSVSVPAKLRKRMEKFAAEQFVNWSAVAANAFSQYIDEMEEK